MRWVELLSAIRLGSKKSSTELARSPFHKDYDRIIFFHSVLPKCLTVRSNSFRSSELIFVSFQSFAFFLGGILHTLADLQ